MPELTKENWEQSNEKWGKIARKTRKKERFINRKGFVDIIVSRKCGYCVEFYGIGEPCCDCSLYKKGICSNYLDESVFYKFLQEMQSSSYHYTKTNWKKALDYAIKILAAIREDEPMN